MTGKHPFWSKYPKESYTFNKEGKVAFEDPKVTSLSPPGIFFNLTITKLMVSVGSAKEDVRKRSE